MQTDEPKLLIYFDDEQRLVRRLGAAVVSCWNELNPVTRERLIDRAKRVHDEEGDERLDNDLRRFITLHDALHDRARAA